VPLLALDFCGDATNFARIFPFFFGGFIVTKSEFAVLGFKKHKQGLRDNKGKCYLRGVPSNLGFVFSCIFGIVSSCVLYHKSSLVLLWFRIGGIFGSF
jgi:hypothetical protein